MAAMTLLDFAKTLEPGPERTIIETYALTTHVTMTLPMVTRKTGVFKWEISDHLPYTTSANATRAIDGNFTAYKGPVEKFATNFKIYGGKLTYDRALVDINPEEISRQQRLHIQAKARIFSKDVFEGAGGQYLRGIKNTIDSEPVYKTQRLVMGTSSTAEALTEDKLDEAISIHNVTSSTYLYTPRKVNLRIKKMARGTGSTSAYSAYALRYKPDEFGTFSGVYDGIPIIPLVDGKGDDILDTTDDSCTIYLVTYGADENFTGFEVSPMKTFDLQNKTAQEDYDYEHRVGTVPQSRRCVTMIKYVSNAQ